jgi:phosphatidylglycerophosphate synthase
MDAPAMPDESRRPLKTRSHAWVQALAKNLAERGLTPNQISLFGIGFAVIGFVFLWAASHPWPFAWGWLLLAAVCVQLRLLCNMLDGLVAVEGGLKAKGGEMFNEIPDRIEDTLFLVGAGMAAHETELGWACAVLAVLTAYLRAFGASLGQPQDFGGPCAKPHRMFLLTVGLVAAVVVHFSSLGWNVLAWMLWTILAGTALTCVLRTRRMYAQAQ